MWTTPDPIGVLGGVNLYGYVHNNPVNKIDLLGLDEPGNGFGPDGTGYADTPGVSPDASPSNVNLGNVSLSPSDVSLGDKAQLTGVLGEIDFGISIPDDINFGAVDSSWNEILGGIMIGIGIARQFVGGLMIGFGFHEMESGAVVPGIHTVAAGGIFFGTGVIEESIGYKIYGGKKSCNNE